MNHLRLDNSQQDRVTLWIDVAGRSVNVLSEPVFDELRQILDELPRHGLSLPVVLRSAKQKGFVVGADLRCILAMETDQQVQQFLLHGQQALHHLEQYAGNTVAFIAGPCLGGGLELALSCRYRIACNTPQTQLGMPEAKLGLIPGWGGTQRLIETIGVRAGLHMLLGGDSVDARAAYEMGLVDALGEEAVCEQVLTQWLRSLPEGYVVTGRRAAIAATARTDLESWSRSQTGAFSPAQSAIIQAVEAGIRQSRESGLRAERELFYPLLMSRTAREKLQRFAGSELRSDGTP